MTNVVDYSGPAIMLIGSECVPFTQITSYDLANQSSLSSSYLVTLASEPVALSSLGSTSPQSYTLTLVSPCQNPPADHYDPGTRTFTLVTALNGCPVLDLTTIWAYFGAHKFAFFLSTLIFGVVLMLLGLYMYRISIWLVGAVGGFGLLLLVESMVVFKPGVPNSLINSIVIVSGVASLFVGYVTLYFPKLGTFGLGAWIGVILSFILNNVALYRIPSSMATLPLIIRLCVLAVAFGVLALFFKKSFVILSTSFIGAYCSIRALSWYLGAFPNEFLISKERQYFGASVDWRYYVYIVALFILTGSSVAVQFWLFRKRAKLLGKSTDVDEYINGINQEIDFERSKYLVFDNVFKKKKKAQVEPKYLQKKRKGSGSQSGSDNYSGSQQEDSEKSGSEEEEQEMQVMPKKLVKFEKFTYGDNKRDQQGKNRRQTKKSSSSQNESEEASQSEEESEEEDRRYKNGKRKEPESNKSLKEKLIRNTRNIN